MRTFTLTANTRRLAYALNASPTWLNIMTKMYSENLQNDNIIFRIGALAVAAYIDRWVADAPSSPGSNAYTFFVHATRLFLDRHTFVYNSENNIIRKPEITDIT